MSNYLFEWDAYDGSKIARTGQIGVGTGQSYKVENNYYWLTSPATFNGLKFDTPVNVGEGITINAYFSSFIRAMEGGPSFALFSLGTYTAGSAAPANLACWGNNNVIGGNKTTDIWSALKYDNGTKISVLAGQYPVKFKSKNLITFRVYQLKTEVFFNGILKVSITHASPITYFPYITLGSLENLFNGYSSLYGRLTRFTITNNIETYDTLIKNYNYLSIPPAIKKFPKYFDFDILKQGYIQKEGLICKYDFKTIENGIIKNMALPNNANISKPTDYDLTLGLNNLQYTKKGVLKTGYGTDMPETIINITPINSSVNLRIKPNITVSLWSLNGTTGGNNTGGVWLTNYDTNNIQVIVNDYIGGSQYTTTAFILPKVGIHNISYSYDPITKKVIVAANGKIYTQTLITAMPTSFKGLKTFFIHKSLDAEIIDYELYNRTLTEKELKAYHNQWIKPTFIETFEDTPVGNTPEGWIVKSGTWVVDELLVDDPVLPELKKGTKYLKGSTSVSNIGIPLNQAFGEFMFAFYTSQGRYYFNNSKIDINGATGYALALNPGNSTYLYRVTSGALNTIFTTSDNLVNKWFIVKIKRYTNGVFDIQIKGGQFGNTWKLLNSFVTDLTNLTSTFFHIYNNLGDTRITLINHNPIEIQ